MLKKAYVCTTFNYVYRKKLTLHIMHKEPSTLNFFLRRIAAFVYDCLLLIALFFVVTGALVPLNDGESIQHWSYYGFLIVVSFLFFDWFWRHGGQTLGMHAWRLKVTSDNGANITFKQTLHRFICGLAMFGITLLFMFGSKDKLALHDKLSRTKIIIYNK